MLTPELVVELDIFQDVIGRSWIFRNYKIALPIPPSSRVTRSSERVLARSLIVQSFPSRNLPESGSNTALSTSGCPNLQTITPEKLRITSLSRISE